MCIRDRAERTCPEHEGERSDVKVLLGIARADAADDGLADDDERHDGRQRFLQTVAKERREQQTERGERDEHGGDEGGVPLRQQHPNASCDDEDEHGPSREEGVDAGGYHEVLDGSGAPVQKREEACLLYTSRCV